MSKAELQNDKTQTYEALVRMIEAGKAGSRAFTKLAERLTWINNEMEKKGYRGE